MKQLNDFDIANMIGEEFTPDDKSTKKAVRSSLKLSKIAQNHSTETPEHITIDFHNHTEEESWKMLEQIATSNTRSATVITGASGILKIKFQQWVSDSILSPYILSCTPINNGSFAVKFHKKKS